MSRPPHRTFVKGLTLSAEERHKAGYTSSTLGTVRVGRLIKAHRFNVPFPDGTVGECSYERLGPAYHRFDYRYFDGAAMPRQHVSRPVINTPEEIEKKGRELALDCFIEAILVERKDYFKRITLPTNGSRVVRRELWSMTAKKAKEHAGKYAICVHVGKKLVPISSALYDTLPDANHAWEAMGQTQWVVACLNRMDRCWETCKYNPIHREGHPRKVEVPDAN